MGSPLRKGKAYTIVGGGISGLMLGYFLKEAGIPIKILEKKDQPGGILNTVKTEHGLAERAANGFIWCKEIQHICDSLSLEILPPKETSKARYIVKNKRLRKIPISFLDAPQIVRAFTKKHKEPFETLSDFGHYFFGKKITGQVIEAAFNGIYGAPAHLLSFPAILPDLAKAFNSKLYLRSAFKKMRSHISPSEKKKRAAGTHGFKNGMGELVLRLSEYLKNEIEYGVDGSQLENENLILTSPAYVSKNIFKSKSEDIFQRLSEVKYNSMISTTLFFEKDAFHNFKEGFGCLIPKNEGLDILGVLFNSCIFDNRVVDDNLISMTVMMRDDSENLKWFSQPESEFIALVVKNLNALFQVKKEPVSYVISKWENGIPLYNTELYQSWFEIDKSLQSNFANINLFGNYTGTISVRGLAQSSYNISKYIS